MTCIKIFNEPLVVYIFTLRNDTYDNATQIYSSKISVFSHTKTNEP